MSALFLEQAFWGFLALVGALIVVIYRLYSGNIGLQLESINRELVSLHKRIDSLRVDIDRMREVKDLHVDYSRLNKIMSKLETLDILDTAYLAEEGD